MFDSILKSKIEEEGQLYIRSDGAFIFRQMPFYEGYPIEKINEKIYRGWESNDELKKWFPGYKNIKPGMYSIATAKSSRVDIYRQMDEGKKPVSLTNFFETSVFALVRSVKPSSLPEKIILIEGAAILILAFGIVLSALL